MEFASPKHDNARRYGSEGLAMVIAWRDVAQRSVLEGTSTGDVVNLFSISQSKARTSANSSLG